MSSQNTITRTNHDIKALTFLKYFFQGKFIDHPNQVIFIDDNGNYYYEEYEESYKGEQKMMLMLRDIHPGCFVSPCKGYWRSDYLFRVENKLGGESGYETVVKDDDHQFTLIIMPGIKGGKLLVLLLFSLYICFDWFVFNIYVVRLMLMLQLVELHTLSVIVSLILDVLVHSYISNF